MRTGVSPKRITTRKLFMVIRLVLSARLLHKCFAFISWTPGLLYICIVSQLCKQAYSLLSALSTCEPPTGHQKIPSALWEPLSSPQDWQTITAQDMALLQNLGYLVPLRSRFPAPVIPVWNQTTFPKDKPIPQTSSPKEINSALYFFIILPF